MSKIYMQIVLQILGLLVLLLIATLVTLKFKYQNADGPSVLFPGGQLVSGQLYKGAEPNWEFTDEIYTLELETNHPISSRRIFVMESAGKLYVPSGYMRSFLGRLWKDWAFNVDAGSSKAVIRLNGQRYERELLRIRDSALLEGVAKKFAQKYAGGASEEVILRILSQESAGDLWIFELTPRSK